MHRSFRALACWIVGLILAVGLPAAAAARIAVVTTTGGRTFEGELIRENDQQVVLAIAGISTPLDRKIVARIQFRKTAEEVYRARRAQLADDDLNGRYDLAYDLFQNGELSLAAQELADLKNRFPDDGRVSRLAVVVEHKQHITDEKPAHRSATPAPDRPSPRDEARPTDAASREPGARLTPEQINLIRVYEARLDERPRIRIPQQTIERFLKAYANDERLPRGREALTDFRRAPGYEQLQWLFEVQAREFYPEVKVWEDPPALQAFRTQLHRQYVLNYCGTARCHGGEPAANAPAGLYLFQTQPNSDRTVYTNFYILDQYVPQRGRMIDRDKPEQSLLLHYGLERSLTTTPHPPVPGWQPQFRSTRDPRFRRYARMIADLWTPKPDYGLDYTPPAVPALPTTQPAEAQE